MDFCNSAPRSVLLSTLGQPALWSLAAAPDGSVYAGTGHSGKVYKLTTGGQESVVWSAQQSEIFALWVDAKGILYAGTSPNGGLYRLENGAAREIWRAPAKYIWAIQPAPGGSLFVATGEPGRVYRIDPSTGAADLYYETGQANVTALASGPNGHLLAGTDPNGILYEISAPKQATILLDSTLPEIRSIAVDAHGIGLCRRYGRRRFHAFAADRNQRGRLRCSSRRRAHRHHGNRSQAERLKCAERSKRPESRCGRS